MSCNFVIKHKGPNIQKLGCINEVIKTYEKFEMALEIPSLRGNFYDESENSVEATFTHQDGTSFKMPGFYFEPYDFHQTGELIGHSKDENSWRIRSMLRKSGNWNIEISVTHNGESFDFAECSVVVEEGDNPRGILSVEPKVRRNFVFENGELFIPIGQNLCWHKPIAAKEKQARYINRIVDTASQYGLNFIRLWTMYWGLAIKTQNCAPNDFSGGQSNAAQLDRIIENLHKNNVYTSLVFFTHGDFSTGADNHWFECPYNAVNPHGYLDNPEEFWRNEKARKDAKSYIRYIIARYGYSPNIMTWELFNEADNVAKRDFEATEEWHVLMADYVRSIDPYKHMVTTSACFADGKIARHEAMDFTYIHCYNYPTIDWALDFQRKDWANQKRPSIFGEIGFMNFNPHIKESLVAPHMSNWAGIMGGSAATGMTWYWEQFDAADGYSIYRPISEFSKQIPWLSENLELVTSKKFNSNNSQVKIIGYLDNNDAYLWLYDDKLSPDKENYTDFNDYKFRYSITDGEYSLKWISTRYGNVVSESLQKTNNGILDVSAPMWRGDIALLIKSR